MICPSHARIARAAETTSIEPCAINMMTRLSQTSAAAPAGSEKSMIGRTVDTWTRATMSAVGASYVISHVAPTIWIRLPKFDTRLAIHIARKMRDRKGDSAEDAGCVPTRALACANPERNMLDPCGEGGLPTTAGGARN